MNLDKHAMKGVGVGAKRRWQRHCPGWAAFSTFSPAKQERVLTGYLPGLALLSWSALLLLGAGIAWLAGASAVTSSLFWFSGVTFAGSLVLVGMTVLVSLVRAALRC